MLLVNCSLKAQNKNQLSLLSSVNQFELAYQHSLISPSLWGEAYVGLGNRDVNSRFDDFLSGLRIGYNAFSNEKNLISFNIGLGFYIPNNDYYKALTTVYSFGLRYNRFLGKANKHCLFVCSAYQYGKQDYKQQYSSETLTLITIDYFEIAPLYFSLGYRYSF